MNRYMEAKAFFFGNEVQKEQVYTDFVLPFFSPILGCFHAERDWMGGPHNRIVIRADQAEILETFPEAFRQYVSSHFSTFSKEEIEANLRSYQSFNRVIPQMERRTPSPIFPENHLNVTTEPYNNAYLKQTFHSYAHFEAHTAALFKIQRFISKHLPVIKGLSQKQQLQYLTRMLYDVITFSSYSVNYSVLVYVSNIEGVLAIAKEQGNREQMEEVFRKSFAALDIPEAFNDEAYWTLLGNEWRNTISELMADTKNQLEQLSISEDGYFSLEEQRDRLINNIEGIDSPFHHTLLADNLDQLLDHKEHKIFKFLINVIYKSIHMMGFPFMKKNIACYAVTQYVYDQFNMKWEDIVKERGEIVDTENKR